MMILSVSLKNKIISILLRDGDKFVAETSWPEGNDLSEKLLPEIDGLLKQAGIGPNEVKNVEVETDLPEGYTANRILLASANAWRTGVGADPNANQA